MAAGLDVTTLAEVKKYAKQSASWTNDDDVLNQLIDMVSDMIEQHLDRALVVTATTEYFDVYPGQDAFYLKNWPATITAVYNDAGWTYGTAFDTSLYTLFDSRQLAFRSPDIVVNGRKALKVAYTGGMAVDAAAFMAAYRDVAAAANMQVWHMYQRIAEEAATSITIGDQALQISPSVGLLPIVKRALAPHRNVRT